MKVIPEDPSDFRASQNHYLFNSVTYYVYEIYNTGVFLLCDQLPIFKNNLVIE